MRGLPDLTQELSDGWPQKTDKFESKLREWKNRPIGTDGQIIYDAYPHVIYDEVDHFGNDLERRAEDLRAQAARSLDAGRVDDDGSPCSQSCSESCSECCSESSGSGSPCPGSDVQSAGGGGSGSAAAAQRGESGSESGNSRSQGGRSDGLSSTSGDLEFVLDV